MSDWADDRGLLLADGLFETLLWSAGGLADFDAHAIRLAAGCAVIGLPAPEVERLRVAALGAVEAAGLSSARAAVRLTWTAGGGGRGLDRPAALSPRLLARASALGAPAGPVRLATVDIRRNETSPTARLKSLAYLDNVLARRAARAAGADEALLLNTRGDVACAAAANLFWFDGDTLTTPALSVGVLAGVTRARVLAIAGRLGLAVSEAAAPRTALSAATGLFLTNSLIGVSAVAMLDGRPCAPHPLLASLVAEV